MTRSHNFIAFISHPWTIEKLWAGIWPSVLFFGFLFAFAGVTK